MNSKLPFLAFVLVVLLFVHPSANALALAELRLNSSLNQPLDATIDVLSASAGDLDSLNTVITRSAMQSDNPHKWPKVKVKLVRVKEGRNYLKLTSEEAVREPLLSFLLDLVWSNGRIQREYSLLIDPQ